MERSAFKSLLLQLAGHQYINEYNLFRESSHGNAHWYVSIIISPITEYLLVSVQTVVEFHDVAGEIQ